MSYDNAFLRDSYAVVAGDYLAHYADVSCCLTARHIGVAGFGSNCLTPGTGA